jgi:hypothetical protein
MPVDATSTIHLTFPDVYRRKIEILQSQSYHVAPFEVEDSRGTRWQIIRSATLLSYNAPQSKLPFLAQMAFFRSCLPVLTSESRTLEFCVPDDASSLKFSDRDTDTDIACDFPEYMTCSDTGMTLLSPLFQPRSRFSRLDSDLANIRGHIAIRSAHEATRFTAASSTSTSSRSFSESPIHRSVITTRDLSLGSLDPLRLFRMITWSGFHVRCYGDQIASHMLTSSSPEPVSRPTRRLGLGRPTTSQSMF